MAEIAADSRGTGVILNPQSFATTSSQPLQPPSRKNHFFTYNNYEINEIDVIVSTLKRFAFKGQIQTEVGENGTPHLQGMIWCHKPHRDTEFKLPKQIHWEKLMDTENLSNYCNKDETHDGIFRCSWGFPKPLNILKKADLYDWQVQMDNCISYEPDDRTIYWIYSKNGGMGKSTFCKYLAYNYKAIICGKGQYSDIINILFNANLDDTNLVVFDLPRNNGNKISYSALEAIKNGMICNTKYETGNKLFNPPHILIFANEEPQWEAMSEDRFKVLCVD